MLQPLHISNNILRIGLPHQQMSNVLEMNKVLYITLLLILLTPLTEAHSGDGPYVNEELNIDLQGIPANLAYLLAYSDAVLIVDHQENNNVLVDTVSEVIHLKKGVDIKIGQLIYIDGYSGNYFDNKRLIQYSLNVGPSPIVYNDTLKYIPPVHTSWTYRKSLFFLRLSKASNEIIEKTGLKNILICKATNGREGQVFLDEVLQKNYRSLNEAARVRQITRGTKRITDQKKLWPYKTSDEFVKFLEKFYSQNGLDKAQTTSPLGKRLQLDSLTLVKKLCMKYSGPANLLDR